jgi:hypothetical protein
MNTTIIYYSSNREDQELEQKVVDNLLAVHGDYPIISVTQKPMNLGTNICIGEKTVCYSNLWRQQLIGLQEAKTDYCITAEADFLYPPDYFYFIPPVKDLVFRYNNVWVLYWKHKNKFWKKPRSEGAQICGREYWISRLENLLGKSPGWEPIQAPRGKREGSLVNEIFDDVLTPNRMWTGNPAINFKTGKGISNRSTLDKTVSPVKELPYWGTAREIHNRVFS